MLIKVEHLSHAHDGRPALHGVGFTAQEGERLVLLGCNGSGKSTLLKIIDGLIPPDAGVVTYDDRPVDRAALADRLWRLRFRREVVLLFQDPAAMLFHPTVAEEVAFGPRQLGLDEPEARAVAWIERAGLAALRDRSPHALSRGEQQKVALASLLVLEPRLLLLDEPTASLDPRSTGWLVDLLQDLETTTVVATHSLSLAPELGSRCLVLGEDHTLLHDGPVPRPDADMDLLRRANLVHRHRHDHDGHVHRHDHVHDWE